jgi:hypothetical protein
MSFNLIATQTDNQIYDIYTIAQNLSWVLPDEIINSSPSSPVLWNLFRKFNNLAQGCVASQSDSMPSGNIRNCFLLHEQILLINPDAEVLTLPPDESELSIPPSDLETNPAINNYISPEQPSEQSVDPYIYQLLQKGSRSGIDDEISNPPKPLQFNYSINEDNNYSSTPFVYTIGLIITTAIILVILYNNMILMEGRRYVSSSEE